MDDFWAHSFSLILTLCVNCSWSLSELRNGFPKMTKRKAKRNAGRSRARHGFKVCENPTVHLAGDSLLPEVNRIGATRAHGRLSLFAIAHDARTIFASWQIDWRAVFQKGMPSDRQVHLRVIRRDGTMETAVAAEPMSAMHYVKTSGLHNAYCLELGYFQPFDTWNSLATSSEVEMPPQGTVELANVDLATIPFHIGFQQLASLFGTANGTPIARVVSEFQKRVLSSDKPNKATRSDTQILSSLNLSLDEMAAVERDFRKIDSGRLARRTRMLLAVGPSSPASGFQQSER
jgi:hypothetical protein